jgi:hypothetical protein
MSLLYGYATGSNTESSRYDAIDDLLNGIPNNTNNLVKAVDVRDSVFTLWERISEVSNVANMASSASATFINPNPTTISVGGIPTGSTFPTEKTVQQMFDKLLYPYTAPSLTLGSLSNKEYGATPLSNLSWSVTKKSENIVTIFVNGVNQNATGGDQSGVQSVTGTYSLPVPKSTTNTFTMNVTDSSLVTTSISTTLTWMNKVYWGYIDLSTLIPSNPNLTTNPVYAQNITLFLNSSKILALNGAGFGTGNELSQTKNKTFTNINGAGKYLIFAWPSSVTNALNPIFTVNNLTSTAFTNVETDWSFTNSYGFTTKYEVWISNTLQNSPATVIIS